jgi:hypothetical protein
MSVRSAAAAPAGASRLFPRPLAWAFGPGDPRQLAALRVGLCSLLLFRLASRANVYLGLADQPRELFRPLSYMALLDEMPARPAIAACLVVGIVAAALAAVGLLARTTLALALAAAMLLNGIYTAQGKVMHNDVLLTLCLLAIVFSRHGDAWSLDAWLARLRTRRAGVAERAAQVGPVYGWPVRAAMIAVALAYLIAGLHKIVDSGGLGWASSENMRWLLYLSSDSQGHNTIALWIADHGWLAHLSAYGLLATECLFFLVLLEPRLRWLFVPATVALHVGTWLTLRLDYSAQLLCVVIVFVTWPPVVAWLAGRRRGAARQRAAALRAAPGTALE